MAAAKVEIPADLMEDRNVTMEVAAAVIGAGRTRIYEEAAAGRLKTVKVGKCRRVRVSDLREYLANLTGGELAAH